MDNDLGKTLGWAALGSISCAAIIWALKRSSSYGLSGKVVLITGGSRGFGLLLAREFSRRGALVAVCARDEQELARVRDEFASAGGTLETFGCDVGDRTQVGKLIESVQDKLGFIDVLVNNAGIIQVGPLENQGLDQFEEAMRANFWSAVYTSLAVLPGMKQKGSGRIVNITSIGGKIAVPHLLPYSASKFALIGFSRGLRAELAKDGIVVTTVVPGLMRTGSPRNVDTAGQNEKEYSWFILGDSLPAVSIDAKRAARKVVEACVAGTAEVILGAPAQIAAILDALAPNVVSAFMSALNEWLLPEPRPGGVWKKGFESENPLTNSILTWLTRRAEAQNNEL